MARISPKSLLYRSKEIICSGLSLVLRSRKLHLGTKHAVLDQVLWVWSEFDGKHKGCKFWSVAARASGLSSKGLVHEHLVPRKVVRKKLFSLQDPSPEQVHRILDRWCVGVVVTNEEDSSLNRLGLNSSMPERWNGRDRWARYTEAKIEIATAHKSLERER